jgi:hypothetical protein
MKYAVEMGSGVMMYIPSFVQIGSGLQTFVKGETQTHRQHGDFISLLLFFENKGSRLKMYFSEGPKISEFHLQWR